MSIEKRKNFLVNFAYYGILLAVFVLVIKFGFSWLLPFVIAFGVASLLKPIINMVNVHLKIKRGVAAVLCVASFYAIAVLILSLAGFQLLVFTKNIFFMLPDFYFSEIEPVLIALMEKLQQALINIDPGLEFAIDDFIIQVSENIGSSISALSVGALTKLSGVISTVPSFFIRTMITIIASFFISIDYYEITYFIARQLNLKQRQLLYEIKEYATQALLKYAKTYSFIMSLTFVQLSIGLFLLRVEKAFLIAFLIAVFDILPVLGTGGVLIPWGLISLLSGKIAFGAGIIILYFIITIIRNTLEPKFIGKQVGLHPVATLLAMYVGSKLFGILGLFLLPVSLAIVKQLNDAGKIKLFK